MDQSLVLLDARWGADVYLRDDCCAVKLFHERFPPEVACRDLLGLEVARAAGIRVPVLREVIEYQGRCGLVFEPLAGVTMIQALLDEPGRAEELGRQLADLHADLHERRGHPLLPLRAVIRAQLAAAESLAEPVKAAALEALTTLPVGTALCHGDFDPSNVFVTAEGPVILEWHNAAAGNPAADVARTILLLRFGGPGEDADPRLLETLNAVRAPFGSAYGRRYAELRPAVAEQVASWMLPMAAFQLMAPIAERERQALLALIHPLVHG